MAMKKSRMTLPNSVTRPIQVDVESTWFRDFNLCSLCFSTLAMIDPLPRRSSYCVFPTCLQVCSLVSMRCTLFLHLRRSSRQDHPGSCTTAPTNKRNSGAANQNQITLWNSAVNRHPYNDTCPKSCQQILTHDTHLATLVYMRLPLHARDPNVGNLPEIMAGCASGGTDNDDAAQ